jgi:hypothetical protein
MVIDNLILSEYVYRYKKLHINNADGKWLFGEENQRPVYCITRIEGANMQAMSIVNTWISCKCSRESKQPDEKINQ